MATFDLTLHAGWSLASFPFVPNENFGELFGSAYFQILFWNGTTYTTVAASNTPETLTLKPEIGKGYWILVLSDITVHATKDDDFDFSALIGIVAVFVIALIMLLRKKKV